MDGRITWAGSSIMGGRGWSLFCDGWCMMCRDFGFVCWGVIRDLSIRVMVSASSSFFSSYPQPMSSLTLTMTCLLSLVSWLFIWWVPFPTCSEVFTLFDYYFFTFMPLSPSLTSYWLVALVLAFNCLCSLASICFEEHCWTQWLERVTSGWPYFLPTTET